MVGVISLGTSNHFPPIAGSKCMNPVTLPPGRARLATKPLPTGLPTSTNTIGIVRVRCRFPGDEPARRGAITSQPILGGLHHHYCRL